jgi:two-component sensor histidine kinase
MFPNLPDLASRALFVFGAVTFSTLVAFYWGERRRRGARRRTVFAAFTLVCAIAFFDSLLLQLMTPGSGGEALAILAILTHHVTAGLLPALLFHVVYEMEAGRLPGRGRWHGLLIALYLTAAFPALRGLNESGLISWGDGFYLAPALMLAAASAFGLTVQALAGRNVEARVRIHRRWIRGLLALMLACSAASLSGFGAFVDPVPDYLLLIFFGVSLYYRERMVFFDLLAKRGAFLGVGLVILTVCVPIGAHFANGTTLDRTAWIYALGILPCWLAAPWIYGRLSHAIDQAWLHRTYSPEEAERQFVREIQIASTEEELQRYAAASLSGIFRAPAEVRFNGPAIEGRNGSEDESLAAGLEHNGFRLGHILLKPRATGLPFLSDDGRLLHSLARTLSLLLENIRFRADRHRQEKREQELRWLASRAELKALRAQINPHFLFNTLSVIAGLVHYQPELADETIEQLAQVFRYTLRKSENEWTNLAEEVDFVSAYLRIEQARFGERLRLEFDIDPAARQFRIPAMSIQPLVENAIKHGVSAAAGRGTVGLRVGLEQDCLSVEVSDNGPGFPPGFRLEDTGNGHGLRNVAERLRGYYGEHARLSWESARPGTRVVLTLPQVDGLRQQSLPGERIDDKERSSVALRGKS